MSGQIFLTESSFIFPCFWFEHHSCYFPDCFHQAALGANPVQLKVFDGKPHPIAICSQIVNQVCSPCGL